MDYIQVPMYEREWLEALGKLVFFLFFQDVFLLDIVKSANAEFVKFVTLMKRKSGVRLVQDLFVEIVGHHTLEVKVFLFISCLKSLKWPCFELLSYFADRNNDGYSRKSSGKESTRWEKWRRI